MCITNLGKQSLRSAVVSGRRIHMYQSFICIRAKESNNWSLEQYKESLKKLITSIDIQDHDGYDELEYKRY